MSEALIGIIVLLVAVNVGCVMYAIKSFRNAQESSNQLLLQALTAERLASSAERQWWQHQVEVALNRSQFPDIAAMQTSSSVAGRSPDPAEAEYVDEKREYELQGENPDGNASKTWPG